MACCYPEVDISRQGVRLRFRSTKEKCGYCELRNEGWLAQKSTMQRIDFETHEEWVKSCNRTSDSLANILWEVHEDLELKLNRMKLAIIRKNVGQICLIVNVMVNYASELHEEARGKLEILVDLHGKLIADLQHLYMKYVKFVRGVLELTKSVYNLEKTFMGNPEMVYWPNLISLFRKLDTEVIFDILQQDLSFLRSQGFQWRDCKYIMDDVSSTGTIYGTCNYCNNYDRRWLIQKECSTPISGFTHNYWAHMIWNAGNIVHEIIAAINSIHDPRSKTTVMYDICWNFSVACEDLRKYIVTDSENRMVFAKDYQQLMVKASHQWGMYSHFFECLETLATQLKQLIYYLKCLNMTFINSPQNMVSAEELKAINLERDIEELMIERVNVTRCITKLNNYRERVTRPPPPPRDS